MSQNNEFDKYSTISMNILDINRQFIHPHFVTIDGIDILILTTDPNYEVKSDISKEH